MNRKIRHSPYFLELHFQSNPLVQLSLPKQLFFRPLKLRLRIPPILFSFKTNSTFSRRKQRIQVSIPPLSTSGSAHAHHSREQPFNYKANILGIALIMRGTLCIGKTENPADIMKSEILNETFNYSAPTHRSSLALFPRLFPFFLSLFPLFPRPFNQSATIFKDLITRI